MKRLIAGLAFILAPIFVSISAEAAVDPLLAAEARRHLEAAALYQEDIAAILNQPTLAAEANQAAAQAAALSDEDLHELLDLSPGRDAALVQLRWAAEKYRKTRDGLHALRSTEPSDVSETDWPEKQCPIDGVQGEDGSWTAYTSLIGTTLVALEAYQAIASACEAVTIEPITVDRPFRFEGDQREVETCSIRVVGFIVLDIGDCQLIMEGDTWGRGGTVKGGELLPVAVAGGAAACSAAKALVVTSEKTQEYLGQYLECWDFGTAEANYERLDVIQEEISQVREMSAGIRRLIFEHTLAVRGGSRPSAAYLPATFDGFLEETRRTVETAVEGTSELGYRMRPGIEKYMNDGDSYRDIGEVKRAFDRYRKAFRLATRSSNTPQASAPGSGKGDRP